MASPMVACEATIKMTMMPIFSTLPFSYGTAVKKVTFLESCIILS